MRAWITPELEYYIAQQRRMSHDVQAPDRPTPEHVWENGTGWIIPADIEVQRAVGEIDTLNRLIFEVLFMQENDKRDLRRKINQLLPDTYTLQESVAVTRVQYRNALINLWRTLTT